MLEFKTLDGKANNRVEFGPCSKWGPVRLGHLFAYSLPHDHCICFFSLCQLLILRVADSADSGLEEGRDRGREDRRRPGTFREDEAENLLQWPAPLPSLDQLGVRLLYLGAPKPKSQSLRQPAAWRVLGLGLS